MASFVGAILQSGISDREAYTIDVNPDSIAANLRVAQALISALNPDPNPES